MNDHCRRSDFFWGALTGGTIALLTVLLCTTKKGKQLQNQVKEIYHDVEDTVKDAFGELEEGVQNAASEAKEFGEKVGKKVKKGASDAVDAAEHLADKASNATKY